MSNDIRCPECGSTDVECVEKPHHNHICYACGHTLLPPAMSGRFTREKKAGRWQIEISAPDASAASGTSLTFTRRGIEVAGWFDHICGTGDGWSIAWADLDEIRKELS